MTPARSRYFVVMRNPGGLHDEAAAANYIATNLFAGETIANPPFTIAGLPSSEVSNFEPAANHEKIVASSRSHSGQGPAWSEPEQIVVALNIGDEKHPAHEVIATIKHAIATPPKDTPPVFLAGSPDIPFASSDHWCVGDAANSLFSDRSGAERLLGIDFLRKQPNVSGIGVNVVIADQGLDAAALGASYGGGWGVGNSLPGTATQTEAGSIRRSHAMMIAENILAVAPQAKLFDLPVAPPRIANVTKFISLAYSAYGQAFANIQSGGVTGAAAGPWVFVNPWGILDRSTEHPLGEYTTSPNNPFNKLMVQMVDANIDVVFAAGNCGQFCPDNRCGAKDQGPGFSIWGANSLAKVLSVGAVRADGMWLGYSAQGPGQKLLGSHKPDFCAASQFCEDGDAFTINTGTSAACGLTAGVVAALRSRWNSTLVPPGKLQEIFGTTARKPPGLAWNNSLGLRLGNGVLNARAAFEELRKQFP